MVIHRIATISTLVAALAAPLAAQTPDPPAAPAPAPEGRGARPQRAPRERSTDFPPLPPLPPLPPIEWESVYDQARWAIENSQFDRALRELDQVIAQSNNGRKDAAMYWKAYSQSKLALSDEALQTIKDMAKQFAASPWVRDAKALELEIQRAAGQPISADLQNDEELKLLALRGVMQSDPDKGLPIIEKMLSSGSQPRVRDRALFVLSQSRSPKAREIMINTARNNSNPELQQRAIRYLGMMGGPEDREMLAGIYRSSSDASVKRAILQSYMMSGNFEKLAEAAKSEKDPELKRMAIRNLGTMNRPGTSDALLAIYKDDTTTAENRRAVINGLFSQRNAKALVDLAKAEKDPQLKKEIVSKLAVMKSPEATDYLVELLK